MKITIDTAAKTIEVYGRASAEDVQRFLDLLADSSWAADLSEWEMVGKSPNDSGTTAIPVPHYLSTPITVTTADPFPAKPFPTSTT